MICDSGMPRSKQDRIWARRLPFDSDSFDAVVSTGSLHHWKQPQECLAEIWRVLKPGGVALLYDLVKDTSPDVLAEAGRAFGRWRMFLLWLHSFEEPFYNSEAMLRLASSTAFEGVETRWVGLLCRLTLRKPKS